MINKHQFKTFGFCTLMLALLSGCANNRSQVKLKDPSVKNVHRNVVYINLKTGELAKVEMIRHIHDTFPTIGKKNDETPGGK